MKIDELLKERGSVHGDFGKNSAGTQSLKSVMRHSPNWEDLPPFMKQALEVIQDKISRILCGDPLHKDHWVDISGYATLVVNGLEEFEETKREPQNMDPYNYTLTTDQFGRIDGVRTDREDADLYSQVACDLGLGLSGKPAWIEWDPSAKGAASGPVIPPEEKELSEILFRDGDSAEVDVGVKDFIWRRIADCPSAEIVGYRTKRVNAAEHAKPVRYSYEDSVAQCDGFPRYNEDGTENKEWMAMQLIGDMIDMIDRFLDKE